MNGIMMCDTVRPVGLPTGREEMRLESSIAVAMTLLTIGFTRSALAQAEFHALGGDPGGNGAGVSRGVSADHGVVVGGSNASNDGPLAFRWTEIGGMQSIGDLPGGSNTSYAWNISDDGQVIVGYSSSTSGQQAFRWTAAQGMQGLGDLPGGAFSSTARAGTSADGAVIA